MKLSSIQKLLVSILMTPLLIVIAGSDLIPQASQKHRVKHTGLTKTLVNLLETRAPENFVLGAYEISMEDLIDTELATVFDCDSLISNYLSEAGEDASYEMLSDAMRNVIWDRFNCDDGTLFVDVRSDTIPDGMYFNLSVYMDRNVSIPVLLNASDTSFSTSFDTTCIVRFVSDIDLFINAEMVNSGSEKDGIRVRINEFSFELTSGLEDDERPYEHDCQDYEYSDTFMLVSEPQKTIPFYLEGEKYSAITRCLSIYAKSYWYLAPIHASDFVVDEGECYTLTYSQLEKGDFKWYNETLSSFSSNLVMIPEGEKWDSLSFAEKGNEFSYVVDNLFDDEGFEHITLCCEYGVNEGVSVRSGKYVLSK